MTASAWILIAFLVHILVSLFVTKKIKRAKYMEVQRRTIHLWLIWLLPFFGAWMTYGFWKKPKDSNRGVMTKSKRGGSKGHFHESGKGIFG